MSVDTTVRAVSAARAVPPVPGGPPAAAARSARAAATPPAALPALATPPAALPALADPVRWAILTRLAQEQLCTCHLQAELGMGQSLVSHHLRVLREAGLVEVAPCGRFTYYRLRPGGLDAAAGRLAQLAAASHADRPRRAC